MMISEHEYHIVSYVTQILTVDTYVVATNKEEAEKEAISELLEEYGSDSKVDISMVKINERDVGGRIINNG